MTSNIPDSYNPFYAGWSNISSAPQNVYGVHHPGGGIKKITLDGTNVNGSGYYWEFQYNDGRVIPGSSGSPLFDNNNRQVGIASFLSIPIIVIPHQLLLRSTIFTWLWKS